MGADAIQLLKTAEALQSRRQGVWDPVWEELSNYVMPHNSGITSWKTPGFHGYGERLYDHTAIEANMTLAEGQLSYITPKGQIWSRYRPPLKIRDNPARKFLGDATDDVFSALNQSNFYSQAFDLYMNRGGMGTGAMLVQEDRETGGFTFLSLKPGTFAIDVNAHRIPDRLMRFYKLKARQAVEEFGATNCSMAVQAAAKDPANEQDFEFVHCIYKRPLEERVPGSERPEHRAWASITIDRQHKLVVREGGFNYQPFVATRYIQWGDEVYGFCPGIIAMPAIRSLNFLEQSMDALVELQIHPRVLVPQNLKHLVDYRPHGVTYFDSNHPAKPEEWLTGGRYDVGRDRVQDKREQVRRAFHADLFQMFANEAVNTKVMSAREVAARESEQVRRFAPIFDLLQKEFLDPLMRTLFAIRYSAGRLGTVPPSLMTEAAGAVAVSMPQVDYYSRIAMAVQSVQTASFLQFAELAMQTAGTMPEYLALIHPERSGRATAESMGVPSEYLRTDAEFAEHQQAQAEIAQAQMAVEAMGRAGPSMAAMSQKQRPA